MNFLSHIFHAGPIIFGLWHCASCRQLAAINHSRTFRRCVYSPWKTNVMLRKHNRLQTFFTSNDSKQDSHNRFPQVSQTPGHYVSSLEVSLIFHATKQNTLAWIPLMGLTAVAVRTKGGCGKLPRLCAAQIMWRLSQIVGTFSLYKRLPKQIPGWN